MFALALNIWVHKPPQLKKKEFQLIPFIHLRCQGTDFSHRTWLGGPVPSCLTFALLHGVVVPVSMALLMLQAFPVARSRERNIRNHWNPFPKLNHFLSHDLWTLVLVTYGPRVGHMTTVASPNLEVRQSVNNNG